MSKRKARGENCMGKKKKCIDLTGFWLDTINGTLKLLATIPLRDFQLVLKGGEDGKFCCGKLFQS